MLFRSASLSPLLGITCEREQTSVLCLWMMALLTAEQSPDERGRSRALSLLHTASLTLQRVLTMPLDDKTRVICLDLYKQVEGEALDLFEPIERIPLLGEYQSSSDSSHRQKPKCESSPRPKLAPWEILTPMREKRHWTSPSTKQRTRK